MPGFKRSVNGESGKQRRQRSHTTPMRKKPATATAVYRRRRVDSSGTWVRHRSGSPTADPYSPFVVADEVLADVFPPPLRDPSADVRRLGSGRCRRTLLTVISDKGLTPPGAGTEDTPS
jgi:hypothetical protein